MAYNSDKVRAIFSSLYEITQLNIIFHKYDINESFGGNTDYYPKLIKDLELNTIKLFTEKLLTASPHSVCFFENKFHLRYIATGYWVSDKYEATIVLGPYLNSCVTNKFIHDVMTKNRLPISLRKPLYEFYSNLSIIGLKKEQAIADVVVNISNENLKTSNPIILGEKDSHITSMNPDYYTVNLENEKIRASYDVESTFLHLVSTGDFERVKELLKEKRMLLVERFPESPLRNNKNFAIVLSTVTRRTVQEQGVDVFYIHNTSEKYALKIEKSQTITELSDIIINMIKEYCDLVKNYSTASYSKLIAKAVNYIRQNYSEHITLTNLAETLYVHPNYLSKKFKADTKKTVSAFINETRINEAKYLLKNTNTTITDIAYMVGFNDKKYFSKVFKKYTGMTPSEYMNS